MTDEEKARMREKGYTTAIYDGKVDKKVREEGYKSFSEGKTQLIFLNQASGAYGLDGLKEMINFINHTKELNSYTEV